MFHRGAEEEREAGDELLHESASSPAETTQPTQISLRTMLVSMVVLALVFAMFRVHAAFGLIAAAVAAGGVARFRLVQRAFPDTKWTFSVRLGTYLEACHFVLFRSLAALLAYGLPVVVLAVLAAGVHPLLPVIALLAGLYGLWQNAGRLYSTGLERPLLAPLPPAPHVEAEASDSPRN